MKARHEFLSEQAYLEYLRDYYAGQAMQAVIKIPSPHIGDLIDGYCNDDMWNYSTGDDGDCYSGFKNASDGDEFHFIEKIDNISKISYFIADAMIAARGSK